MKGTILEKGQPLGIRLKSYREQKNMSLRDISEALGVPKTTYREWEEGRKVSNHQALIKLAEVFELSLYELLTGIKVSNDDLIESVRVMENQLAILKRNIFLMRN